MFVHIVDNKSKTGKDQTPVTAGAGVVADVGHFRLKCLHLTPDFSSFGVLPFVRVARRERGVVVRRVLLVVVVGKRAVQQLDVGLGEPVVCGGHFLLVVVVGKRTVQQLDVRQ